MVQPQLSALSFLDPRLFGASLGFGTGGDLARLHSEQVVSAALEALANLGELSGARNGAANLPARHRTLADIPAISREPLSELLLGQPDRLTPRCKARAEGGGID